MRGSLGPQLIVAAALTTACLPDNPSLDAGSNPDTGTDTDTGEPVSEGLLGCPSGERCTLIVLSQTLDDRVEVYAVEGPGPRYRGALDLDLKPNPGGDISGELLDEPYGLAWDGSTLHVLLGHYPTRKLGALLSFPAASLADAAPGAFVPRTDWFSPADGSTRAGVTLRALEREEPTWLHAHPSGELLVAVFGNDLMVPPANWTNSGELLAVGPDGATRAVEVGCAGAWQLVPLDGVSGRVAVACEGDEAMAILNAAPVAQGAAPAPVCVGNIGLLYRRVRHLAEDGLGGALVADSPTIPSTRSDAQLWWFDDGCQLRGVSTLDGAVSWDLRQIVRLPSDAGPRWLLGRADGSERGVLVVAGDPATGEAAVCGRLDALDEANAWVSAGSGETLEPYALATVPGLDGTATLGVAVSAAPADYDEAGPGEGALWWLRLDASGDPCEAAAMDLVELSASAPAVDPDVPQTWRRGPQVLEIVELGP